MTIPIITLMAVVTGTSTNVEGDALYAALAPYVAAGEVVRLSLRGATPMSSSFLHSSVGELIDRYGLDAFRHSLKLVDFLPSHAAIMKRYVDAVAAGPALA